MDDGFSAVADATFTGVSISSAVIADPMTEELAARLFHDYFDVDDFERAPDNNEQFFWKPRID